MLLPFCPFRLRDISGHNGLPLLLVFECIVYFLNPAHTSLSGLSGGLFIFAAKLLIDTGSLFSIVLSIVLIVLYPGSLKVYSFCKDPLLTLCSSLTTSSYRFPLTFVRLETDYRWKPTAPPISLPILTLSHILKGYASKIWTSGLHVQDPFTPRPQPVPSK